MGNLIKEKRSNNSYEIIVEKENYIITVKISSLPRIEEYKDALKSFKTLLLFPYTKIIITDFYDILTEKLELPIDKYEAELCYTKYNSNPSSSDDISIRSKIYKETCGHKNGDFFSFYTPCIS